VANSSQMWPPIRVYTHLADLDASQAAPHLPSHGPMFDPPNTTVGAPFRRLCPFVFSAVRLFR
jgi:hypothetical protein